MCVELLDTTYKQYKGFTFAGIGTSWAKKSDDSKTFYWYNTASSSTQLNEKDNIYYYLAILQ